MSFFEHLPPTPYQGLPTLALPAPCETTVFRIHLDVIYTVTPGGRLIGAVVAVIGIGLLTLSSSILASGFIEEWSGEDGELHHCPGCGEDLQQYRE